MAARGFLSRRPQLKRVLDAYSHGAPMAWSDSTDAPQRSEALRHQARAAMSEGRWGEATALLREAFDLHPQSINVALLGACLLKQGDLKQGILHLAAAVGLGHNQFKDRVELAEAFYSLGEAFRHDALWQIEEALRINPRYRRAKDVLRGWLSSEPSLREHIRPQILAALGSDHDEEA
jgi:tetratricopeptide (TPR) repeat protein